MSIECQAEDCKDGDIKAFGFCKRHYQRYYRTGDSGDPERFFTCVDCDSHETAPLTGPMPKRCKDCAREWDLASKRARSKRATEERRSQRPPPAPCVNCGAPLERVGRGRPKERCSACLLERKREHGREGHARNRDSRNAIMRERWFAMNGITREDYEDLLVGQGGCCAICGGPPTGIGDRFHIDHDHSCCPGGRKVKACGKCIRGLLCFGCNAMLGQAKDDPDRLRAAIAYLNK